MSYIVYQQSGRTHRINENKYF